MNEHFSWYRLRYLIRNDFLGGMRFYLNSFAVVSIIVMLSAIPSAGFGQMKDGLYYGWFGGLLIWWGTVHASMMFAELHNKTHNNAYLLLPASALEKTIAKYLYGSVFFVIHLLIFITVLALLIEGINMLIFGRANGLFNPFSFWAWEAIGAFMVIQPLFFLGGAWFRKYKWFKTVITLWIIGFGLGLLALITSLIFFAGYSDGLYSIFSREFINPDWEANKNLFEGMVIGLKILCFGVIPPLCFYITWLRVKETQVSHGV